MFPEKAGWWLSNPSEKYDSPIFLEKNTKRSKKSPTSNGSIDYNGYNIPISWYFIIPILPLLMLLWYSIFQAFGRFFLWKSPKRSTPTEPLAVARRCHTINVSTTRWHQKHGHSSGLSRPGPPGAPETLNVCWWGPPCSCSYIILYQLPSGNLT